MGERAPPRFPRLDTEAADLHLLVDAPQELEGTARRPAHADPRCGRAAAVRQAPQGSGTNRSRGQLRTVPIAPGQAVAAEPTARPPSGRRRREPGGPATYRVVLRAARRWAARWHPPGPRAGDARTQKSCSRRPNDVEQAPRRPRTPDRRAADGSARLPDAASRTPWRLRCLAGQRPCSTSMGRPRARTFASPGISCASPGGCHLAAHRRAARQYRPCTCWTAASRRRRPARRRAWIGGGRPWPGAIGTVRS